MYILISRGRTPFGQDQESRPLVLVWPDFLSMHKFSTNQICQIWWKVSINNMVKWSCDSSVIVLIIAIADDQVCYLINLGIPAIAITNDEDSDIILQFLNGHYIVVFGSQEHLLSTTVWRGNF